MICRDQLDLESTLVHENPFSSEKELLGWISDALDEGFSGAYNFEDSTLFVKERRLDLVKSPYWIFDSLEGEDSHFFASSEQSILGVGVAKEWVFSESSFGDVDALLNLEHVSQKMARKIWLMGGWSFPKRTQARRAREKRTWSGFPFSRWVIPALTLNTVSNEREGRLVLAFCPNGYPSSLIQSKLRSYYEKLARTLIAPQRKPHPSPAAIHVKNRPSRERWKSLVRRGLKSIHEGDLKKVVLARSMEILFDHDLSCSTVLQKLIESNPQSTIFAIRKDDAVFMGCTPESLLILKNRELMVDCLAASTSRSSDPTTDELLARELLEDRKSRYEHQLVVDQITKLLSNICSETKVQESPSVKKLPKIQHLHTIAQGRLRPKVSILSVARTLWPTPAINGEPKEAAMRWIQEFEGIDRGWYSGVVGCLNGSGDDGKLLVSIRSGVIRGNRAVLFAGAGIVPQSDPEKEFEETEWKMATMLDALASTHSTR